MVVVVVVEREGKWKMESQLMDESQRRRLDGGLRKMVVTEGVNIVVVMGRE